MVISSQLYMFKCQKQVETAAYSNHILSITLETTVYLNDSDKTKPITTLKHFILTQNSIKGLVKEKSEKNQFPCTLNENALKIIR